MKIKKEEIVYMYTLDYNISYMYNWILTFLRLIFSLYVSLVSWGQLALER